MGRIYAPLRPEVEKQALVTLWAVSIFVLLFVLQISPETVIAVLFHLRSSQERAEEESRAWEEWGVFGVRRKRERLS